MTLPRTAYVTLWFPKPSETFVFREATMLRTLGLPLRNYNLYAPLKKKMSPEMLTAPLCENLGTANTHKIIGALFKHFAKTPGQTWKWLIDGPFNKPQHLEGLGENFWAFCCGLHLAHRFEKDGIEHIHAPWSNGPAMAAWVASRLTGIPFSFAGRAHDIYPPDGAMKFKIADAEFVRVNHEVNVRYMQAFAPEHANKIKLIYNALSLIPSIGNRKKRTGPIQLLAAGRFVKTKGFNYLLDACDLLRNKGVKFSLVLAGSGTQGWSLKRQTARLGLQDRVTFPGFLRHDELSKLMLQKDALIMPCVVGPKGDGDGIPNVIMEAYAHGMHVVSTDVAGIHEVVQNDKTGFLVEQRNSVELAGAIQTLVEQPDNTQKMADNGKALVLKMFDQEQNAKKMLELISTHSKRKEN